MLTVPGYDAPGALFTLVPHPVAEAAHFLPLPGARALVTPGLRETARAIAVGVAERAVVCVHGRAGVGKTFAVRAVLDGAPPARRCLLTLRSRPDAADLRAALHHALGLSGAGQADPGAHDVLITDAITGRSPIVVVDEAHQLSPACFEYLRYVHDAVPGGVCIVLIAGEGGERILDEVRMLASRCAARAEITPLRPERIAVAVSRLHRLWKGTRPGLLRRVDADFAHGRLRRWAALTRHTHRVLAASGAAEVTGEILGQAIRRLDPGFT
ncbi:ATP-binding protein [Streptomyces sp. NPDC046161]|uniref:ATP-binding protein n=1 Tax=Streptomyces sp. NPDC046161 TaxID=3155132 RepID=UPI0033C18F2E